jgi:hypothetical protein
MPVIVASLLRNPVYARLVVGNPFPQTASDFKIGFRSSPLLPADEFAWCAAVLQQYTEPLAQFVVLREVFTSHYLRGDYVRASEALNQIEASHGVSLWLIAHKMQLIQITSGLQAQKTYCESILSTEGISIFAAFMSYYFSMRSEENVSLSSLRSDTEEFSKGQLHDYALVHVIPFDICEIRNPVVPIYYEQTQPIIDRFQTFVSMALLALSRESDLQQTYVTDALRLICPVGDPRVTQLLHLLDGQSDPLWRSTLDTFDIYNEGNYVDASHSNNFHFELHARSRLHCETPPESVTLQSISTRVEASMTNLLTARDYHSSAVALQKLALSCGTSYIAAEIPAFLLREHDHIRVHAYSELDRFAALNSPFGNPWNAKVVTTMRGGEKMISALQQLKPTSTSLALQRVIRDPNTHGIGQIMALPLPSYRRELYLGHLAMRLDDFSGAILHYQAAGEHGNLFAKTIARTYSFEPLYETGLLQRALSLTIDHCLQSPDALRLYPVEPLAVAAAAQPDTRYGPDLLILLHLLSKQIHVNWERNLSDSFENFLSAYKLGRPSDLAKCVILIDRRRLIYILKNICIPRILDDMTIFQNVDEIEEERIAICRTLMTLDPGEEKTYSDEIRGIVRNMRITELLHKVETSQIYVDEDGIRTSVEEVMKDLFARYQILLQHPDVDYQAEKISQRMVQLLGEKNNAELNQFQLPSSEREGLFSAIVAIFVTQFALDPAHGLDTHLSTTIRHGAFEGHVRNPFATEDLLCSLDQKRRGIELPARWRERFPSTDESEHRVVLRQMSRFTEKLEEVVDLYLRDLLRVRGDAEQLKGLFNFQITRAERLQLMTDLTPATGYDAFIASLFEICWTKADASLIKVREELRETLQNTINLALGSLIAALEANIRHERVADLVDAVVRARTAFQVAVDEICGWFHRPVDLRRSPFEIDLAIGVAVKQIEKCYEPIYPEIGPNVEQSFDGALFDGLVEIFFILLQNVVRHSRTYGVDRHIKVRILKDGGKILIEVENRLSLGIDIEERRGVAEGAMARYGHDTALKMARVEGGSGLSKIWRILEYDLKKAHRLSLEVTDDYFFRTSIWVSDRDPPLC